MRFTPAVVRSAVADDESNTAIVEVDARERELRRKEQELLRVMDLNAAEKVANPSQKVVDPSKESLESKSLDLKRAAETTNVQGRVLEIKAPESKVQESPDTEQDPRVVSIQSDQQQPIPLKDLAHHPALEPPPKVKIEPPPLVATSRIRTRTVEEAPDGTTANRLGSFYRIDRADLETKHKESGGRRQTVPIRNYKSSEVIRPALLTSDELATIQNPSTWLKTGPHRLDSTLIKIPQNAEVRIDYRSGEWYRIKTTGGIRGWVIGSALLFDTDTPPSSTVRVGAVLEELE